MLSRTMLLFGHTHQPALWELDVAGTAKRVNVDTGRTYRLAISGELPSRRLLNPGAVCDQTGARWLELDFTDNASHVIATWRRTAAHGHGGKDSTIPNKFAG